MPDERADEAEKDAAGAPYRREDFLNDLSKVSRPLVPGVGLPDDDPPGPQPTSS